MNRKEKEKEKSKQKQSWVMVKDGKVGGAEMVHSAVIEDVTSATLYNSWAVGTMDDIMQAREVEELQRVFEDNAINYYNERHDQQQIFHLADALPVIREGMTSVVNVCDLSLSLKLSLSLSLSLSLLILTQSRKG